MRRARALTAGRWARGGLAALLAGLIAGGLAGAQETGDAGPSPTAVTVRAVAPTLVTQWHFSEGVAQAERKAFLQFEVPGRVTFIATDEDGKTLRAGSRVGGPVAGARQGQLIARLDERDRAAQAAAGDAAVAAARRRVEAAEAELTQARQDFERQRRLRDRDLTAEAAFEAAQAAFRAAEAQAREAEAGVAAAVAQAEEAKLGFERTSLFAPFDGVIAAMNIREEDFVAGPAPDPRPAMQEANAAAIVIDDRRFEVELHLPPHEADRIAEGQRALVAADGGAIAARLSGTGGPAVLEGEVWSVSPSVSLQRRTVSVIVRVAGAPGVIRDGAYVSVWIAAAEEPQALAVPYAAIITDGAAADQAQVFVVDPDTRLAARRRVTLGLLGLETAEIVDGVVEDELVVVLGHHRLRDAAPVRVIAGDGPAR